MRHVFPQRPGPAGFSLIELLTVIALVSLLTALTGFSVSSMFSGRAVDNAAREFAGAVEQAQAYSVAQRAPVYVAFAVDSDPARGGIAFCAYVERENAAGVKEVVPLMRTKYLPNVQFASAFSITGGAPSGGTGVKNITEAGSQFGGANGVTLPALKANGKTYTATHVVRIGPSGDIRVEADKIVRSLQFAVRRLQGTAPAPVKVFAMDGLLPSIKWQDGISLASGT